MEKPILWTRVVKDHFLEDLDQRSRSKKWSRSLASKDHFKIIDLDQRSDHFKRSLTILKWMLFRGVADIMHYCNRGTLSRYLPNYLLIQSHFALGQIAMLYPVSSLVMGLREIEGIRAIG